MEIVSGPFHGYYAAVRVRASGAKFQASYKVCAVRPADYSGAISVRCRRVEGLMDTMEEARDIAEQLARLQIAGLSGADLRNLPPEKEGTAGEMENSWDQYPAGGTAGTLYSPTEPAPLYALSAPTEPCPLYAPTEPAPLLRVGR
jgi:hypothetical protein